MAKLLLRQILAAMWPAIAVVGLLAVCQVWQHWIYPHADNQRALQVNAFIGWIGILFLAATVAGIIWAAGNFPSASSAGGRAGVAAAPSGLPPASAARLDRGRLFLGYAMLLDACGIYLLAEGLGGRFITFPEVLRMYVLLAAWVAMWMQLVCLLRRIGRPAAAAIAMGLAMLFFAGPVTLLPLARAAGGHTQEAIVRGIGCATPLLGCFDAMKHSLLIGWAQQPEMYRLSSLGQDIPMALPPWWHNALAYAALAAVFWCVRLIPGVAPERRPRPGLPSTPQDPAAFSIKK